MANILPTEKEVAAISMLAEGSSIRSVERITGIHRDTIMRLGVRVGIACDRMHDAVHELFQDKTVWKGEVEVFDLIQHPKAKRAYAWAHKEGKNDERTRYVAVLELPPVESAVTAVRASIMADGQQPKSE